MDTADLHISVIIIGNICTQQIPMVFCLKWWELGILLVCESGVKLNRKTLPLPEPHRIHHHVIFTKKIQETNRDAEHLCRPATHAYTICSHLHFCFFYPEVSYYYTSSNNVLNASNRHSKAISCKLSNWKIFRLKFSWNQKWTGEKYNLNIQLTIQSVWYSQCKVNKCMCSWNSVFVPFFLGITHISKD